MKKNKIVITGGAGFVGTNLINLLLKKTKYKIISIDNYSSGLKKNHIKNKRVNYIKADTKNISQILKNSKNINSIFHFGEFARIYQSFIMIFKYTYYCCHFTLTYLVRAIYIVKINYLIFKVKPFL